MLANEREFVGRSTELDVGRLDRSLEPCGRSDHLLDVVLRTGESPPGAGQPILEVRARSGVGPPGCDLRRRAGRWRHLDGYGRGLRRRSASREFFIEIIEETEDVPIPSLLGGSLRARGPRQRRCGTESLLGASGRGGSTDPPWPSFARSGRHGNGV